MVRERLEAVEVLVEGDDGFGIGAGQGEGGFFEAVVAGNGLGGEPGGGSGGSLWGGKGFVGIAEEFAEVDDDLIDGAGVGVEFHAGGGAFLGGSGELLGDLFHAGDGASDLFDAAGLLFAAAVDLFDEGFGSGGGGGDAGDGSGDFVEFLFAFGGAGDGLFDELSGVFCGLGGALGEVTDLIGDDGETHTGFAGAGGFDGGIEGEDVGLEGDVVDDFDDFGDAAGGGGDFVHGLHHLVEGEVGLLDDAVGILGALGSGAGVFGIAGGHGVNLFGAGGGFLEGGGLFTGGLGDRLGGGGDLAGGGGELAGVVGEFLDRVAEDAGDGALVVEHADADGETDEAEDGEEGDDVGTGGFGAGAEGDEDRFFVLDELAGVPAHLGEPGEDGGIEVGDGLVHFLCGEFFDDALVTGAEGFEIGADELEGLAGFGGAFRALEFGKDPGHGLIGGGQVAAGLIGLGGLLEHGGDGQLAFEVFEAFGGSGDLAGEHLVAGAFVDGAGEPGAEVVGDPECGGSDDEGEDDGDPGTRD